MASFNKFNQFVADVANKVHNLGADTLKIALTNTAPTATNAIFSDITEITAANGYVAGGNTLTLTSSTQSGGLYKLIMADTTFTASGGSINTFRYAVLYNSTPTSPLKPLIGYWDYGTAVNITSGNSFLVDLDQVNGVLQLA